VDQCAGVCSEVLDGAREQLRQAGKRLAEIGSDNLSSLTNLQEKLVDVRVWLSSALSLQTSCTDNFELAPAGAVRSRIQAEQSYLAQVIGDSICLVSTLSEVGNDLGKWFGDLPQPPPFIGHPGGGRRHHHRQHHRHLLSAREFGLRPGLDFPTWVSPSERRLLQSSASSVSADVVVAKDGSGQFSSVAAAVAAIPSSVSRRYVVYIKKGVYSEVFNVSHKSVTFVGDGMGATIITGSRNVASGDYNTYRTSTVGKCVAAVVAPVRKGREALAPP
jgi:pectinesterase